MSTIWVACTQKVTIDSKLTSTDKTGHTPAGRLLGMDTQRKAQRGRPPLGRTRMVTIGIRVEPAEREQLEAMAAAQGKSLCGYLRDLIRHELAEDDQTEPGLRAAS